MRGAETKKARSPSFSLVYPVIRSLLLAERFDARPGTEAVVFFKKVLEKSGCSSIGGLMDKQAEFEFNPLLHWQPMERFEC